MRLRIVRLHKRTCRRKDTCHRLLRIESLEERANPAGDTFVVDGGNFNNYFGPTYTPGTVYRVDAAGAATPVYQTTGPASFAGSGTPLVGLDVLPDGDLVSIQTTPGTGS